MTATGSFTSSSETGKAGTGPGNGPGQKTDVFQRPTQPERRVVVTGVGLITPLGLTMQESWKNAVNGISGIDAISAFDASGYDVHFAGEVKGFDPNLYIEKKEQKKMDRFIHLSMAAAQMAIQDCGLSFAGELGNRTGSIIGVGIGGLGGIETQHSILRDRGPFRISPFFIPMVISNMAAGQISIRYGLKGPNYSVTSACASGAHSIGESAQYIRRGLCDVMIAGGAEAAITPMAIGGFSAMKALSTRNDQPKMASRPFDRDRDGFVLSEAAAILVLEDYEHASRRGAHIYGEVSGYGVSSDAYHMTNPAPGGTGGAHAMGLALKDAGLSPEQIQYVNAHGTSTPVGDGLETQGIKSVFGQHAKKLWVSSTKSMMGHSLGAAGAVESIFSLMALKENIAPPTINLENPSEDCDLDYVPLTARDGKFQHVLNNSFGFGGTNASLVFSKI
jgi:3-oxoacyl-[acyl-carrier-protein] synthase II